MGQLYFPFTLRLYGHVLLCLRDHDFTGRDLFYRIKDCWKGRDKPDDLLVKPLENGLAFKIGEWCFATLFDGISESMAAPYVTTLKDEDLLWFLEDIAEAAKASGAFSGESFAPILALTTQIQELYETDEPAYWEALQGERRKNLIKMFLQFCKNESAALGSMRSLYAPEVADRILHDRQLCAFIAETVMNIGFDGETSEGIRGQWVEREAWPARVKIILNARDRGKCSSCGADIVMELDAEGHIDHMFPISLGGCNDLVNLQLLCSSCNLRKLAKQIETTTSVPQYIRRKSE